MSAEITIAPEPRRYPCRRCGGTVSVSIAEAQSHRERFHPTPIDEAKARAREAAAERMKDPDFQKKLRAAKAAKAEPAREGEEA